jgi:hypothetical protein
MRQFIPSVSLLKHYHQNCEEPQLRAMFHACFVLKKLTFLVQTLGHVVLKPYNCYDLKNTKHT